MTWTDVSSEYEGVFFRVVGGGAGSFGVVQQENVPLNVIAADDAAVCGDWEQYKDEHCYKLFDSFHTFNDAEKLCQTNNSTLVVIHFAEEQNFLANFLFTKKKVVDNLWIGAKFIGNGLFQWEDHTTVKDYNNWAPGYPRNLTDHCVQMFADEPNKGKWTDEPCARRNLVICQRTPPPSLRLLAETVIELKHTLQQTASKLVETEKTLTSELAQTNKKVAKLEKESIPIGFTYVQLPKDKAPGELWPSMTWTDISSEYEGVFFRVVGGGADNFGAVQQENAPRLEMVHTVNVIAADDAAVCGDWEQYKDEHCYKLFDSFHTFNDAEKLCQTNNSTLVVIHYAEEQNFLANFLFTKKKVVDNLWVGAKFVGNGLFQWEDHTTVKDYNNWAPGYPKNITDHCVQISADESNKGKWTDEPCARRNLVICQQRPLPSLMLLAETVIELKHTLQQTAGKLAETEKTLSSKLAQTEKELEKLKKEAIPIGFTYVQLPKDKAPGELWPSMTWTDVSKEYEGVFFRVVGGGAGSFGVVQQENAPRLEMPQTM
ncbi:hypothetical protein TYRP_023674 [Tyrophagus putrescentiae]|nr:hypothetical protein TYRP_023674 [Tyrophagus putrescentiae]